MRNSAHYEQLRSDGANHSTSTQRLKVAMIFAIKVQVFFVISALSQAIGSAKKNVNSLLLAIKGLNLKEHFEKKIRCRLLGEQ